MQSCVVHMDQSAQRLLMNILHLSALSLCLIALLPPPASATTLDANDFSNPALWAPYLDGSGPAILQANNGLTLSLPAGSSAGADGHIAAAMLSTFFVHGDFNIIIDYTLLSWPYGNGARAGIEPPWYCMQRLSWSAGAGDAYAFDCGGVKGSVPTSDMAGRLRFERSGSTLSGYYWDDNNQNWILLDSGLAFSGDWQLSLCAWSEPGILNPQTSVEVKFTNLKVTADQLIGLPNQCPDGGSTVLLLGIVLCGCLVFNRPSMAEA
jgi:hypothetical protein